MFRSSIESLIIHAVIIILLFSGASNLGTGDANHEGTLQISTHIVEEHDPGEGEAPTIQEEQPPVEEKQVEVVEKEPEIVEPIEEEKVTEIEDNKTVEEPTEVVEKTEEIDNATQGEQVDVANNNSPTATTAATGADGGDGSGAAVAKGGASGLFSLIDVDLVPKLRNRKKPEYPSYAKENRIEGKVRLGFIVDTKGRVQNPVIIEASPANVFEKSALKTVSSWRFEPAKKDGKKVDVKMAITLRFRLEDIE